MGQARVWIRPQRGFGSRAWGAARAFQTAGGPAGEDHACLLSSCWLQRALGQASGNPQGGAPSTQLSSGKGPHLLQTQPLSGAAASNCVWELAVKHKKDDPAAPTPWSSGFAPSPPPSGKIQWPLWAPSKDLWQSTIPPKASLQGPLTEVSFTASKHTPVRTFFFGCCPRQTHLLRKCQGTSGCSSTPSPTSPAGREFPGIYSFWAAQKSGHLLWLNQEDDSSAQLRGPHAARTEPWDTGTTCALGAHPTHTHSPTSLPQAPCSSYTRMRLHSCPWVKARSLRLHSHTWRDTHTFKGFSLQKGQHDCPCANWAGTGG